MGLSTELKRIEVDLSTVGPRTIHVPHGRSVQQPD
jgi:hypothetical protein